MLRLTFEAGTFSGLEHELRLFLKQVEAQPGEMARYGMAEEMATDSPDAFVPDFKDDFNPHLNEVDLEETGSRDPVDDPLPEAMPGEPEKKSRKRTLKPKKPKRKAKAKEPAAEPKKASRRKGNGKAGPPKSNPAKAAVAVGQGVGLEISDGDVAKAASSAAQVLTPKVVQEVKGEYGVNNVQELDQDQRRSFIDQLNAKLEEANG